MTKRIGLQDRSAGDRIVTAGRIDDDDVGFLAKLADRRFQLLVRLLFEHLVAGLRQGLVEPAHGRVAVLEIAGHGPLAAVEIERSDVVTGRGKRDRGVNGSGRFAGAALFIGEDDKMRLGHGPHPLELFPRGLDNRAPLTVYRRV